MSKKVTYAAIIEALSDKTGFSKLKSEAFTKALIRQIKRDLEETGKASITNFGSFKVKQVAERQGQNPQTGEPITIPAHNRVSFTPYKALKEEVNANFAHLETELIEEESAKAEVPEAESPLEPGQELEQEPETKPEPEPEPESEPVFEPEPEPEKKPEVFAPRTMQRDRTRGKNLSLIIVAVLGLAIIAIASVWFLMSSDEEELASEQSAVEQPQTPQAETRIAQDKSDENVQTDNQEQQDEPEEPVVAQQAQEQAPRTAKEPVNTSGYTVGEDEWYWIISRNVYGKSHFWPLIFKQNFTVDHHPDSLEKNVRLEVPALEGSSENPTKSDYRRLAAAAKMVSDAYLKYGRTDKAEEYAMFARRWENAGQE